MNEITQRLMDKTGLSEEQATNAVDTVLQFLKEKLPSPLSSQLDNVTDGASGIGDKLGGIGASLGGMFGSKQS